MPPKIGIFSPGRNAWWSEAPPRSQINPTAQTLLVTTLRRMYGLPMLNRFVPVVLACLSGLSCAFADTVQLKDKAAIMGKILARKHDQVVVDVGYTVLVVPRNQIDKIIEGDSPVRADKKTRPPAAAGQPADKSGLFQSATAALPERSVRELVGQLGAAVVQV